MADTVRACLITILALSLPVIGWRLAEAAPLPAAIALAGAACLGLGLVLLSRPPRGPDDPDDPDAPTLLRFPRPDSDAPP